MGNGKQHSTTDLVAQLSDRDEGNKGFDRAVTQKQTSATTYPDSNAKPRSKTRQAVDLDADVTW